MAKSAETYDAVAETFKEKGDRHYAKGCAAAEKGDKDTANQEHAAAKTCYETMKRAQDSARDARRKQLILVFVRFTFVESHKHHFLLLAKWISV